jgi:hypothetical protein
MQYHKNIECISTHEQGEEMQIRIQTGWEPKNEHSSELLASARKREVVEFDSKLSLGWGTCTEFALRLRLRSTAQVEYDLKSDMLNLTVESENFHSEEYMAQLVRLIDHVVAELVNLP